MASRVDLIPSELELLKYGTPLMDEIIANAINDNLFCTTES